jgi:dCMP deaminase
MQQVETVPGNENSKVPTDNLNILPEHVDDWDEYFMWMATTAAIKSKDPKCAVGAVIVSKDHLILSTGFNGLARRVHDDQNLLADAAEKLKVICHAEENAIYNAARIGIALEGTSIYVTKFPCLGCCNAIIQSGISRIYTHDDRYWDDDPADKDHSRKRAVIHQSGIKVEAPFHPDYKPSKPIQPRKLRKGPGRSGQEVLPELLEEAK